MRRDPSHNHDLRPIAVFWEGVPFPLAQRQLPRANRQP
jgi:hypothetical protein